MLALLPNSEMTLEYNLISLVSSSEKLSNRARSEKTTFFNVQDQIVNILSFGTWSLLQLHNSAVVA